MTGKDVYKKSSKNHGDESGLGSFKLVKYFSFSSLGVILLCTFLLSWLISDNARTVMLEQNEEYSRLLAENINQQVFRRFVLPAVIRYGEISLRKPEQAEILDGVIKSIIQGLEIETVTIYDSSRNIISYSTNVALVGKENLGKNEYRKALAGKTSARLRYSGSVLSLLHLAGDVDCRLNTFIPFRQLSRNGKESDNIMGVVEVQKDLTDSYTNILRFQGRIMIVSCLLMGGLFLILRFIVSRAGEKLERRAQERQRLREKLDQAERLAHLGTMIATVSHELKSPLGIVRSTAEVLAKRIEKYAPGNEHLAQIVVKETERLNGIVVEFLDFARPQNMQFAPQNINEVCRSVLAFLQPELQKQNITLTTRFASSIPLLPLDQDQFYRALLNILLNSVQAMPQGGELVVVSKERVAGGVELSIADTGMGMSEEVSRQIFTPFYTRKRKGTGLGLPIAKDIIEKHGATISVTSEEGKGTRFLLVWEE